MKQIVECVPNFSEGRSLSVVKQITDAIESAEDVTLLNVDPGESANRTVVTFVGTPEGIVEAAFRAVKKAGEVIDMRLHHGTHPRIGATDVLPLIPVSGITLEECAGLARRLARRIATEAGIPCYCYEASAFRPERKNLAVCRAGEYEALPQKLADPARRPDFMPPLADGEDGDGGQEARGERIAPAYRGNLQPLTPHILKTGCTVVGARDFLIAVNFNLDTTSTSIAKEIACDVREKGRQKFEDGKPVVDADGKPVMIPGTLKCTKAIGWYIDEYGIAQVSMNLTNINVTPLHMAFEEVSRCAEARGVRVTGTEIVGLVPKNALADAGRYFLEKQYSSIVGNTSQHCNTDLTEDDIINIAIKSMGLDDLRPFNPREKVIEYLMEDRA